MSPRPPSIGRAWQLTDRLALALLQGEIREEDSVTVDARDGELLLQKQDAAAPAPA